MFDVAYPLVWLAKLIGRPITRSLTCWLEVSMNDSLQLLIPLARPQSDSRASPRILRLVSSNEIYKMRISNKTRSCDMGKDDTARLKPLRSSDGSPRLAISRKQQFISLGLHDTFRVECVPHSLVIGISLQQIPTV